MSRSTKF
ncbi:hypothetical protein D018_2524, partial [Vibrio parahaemolyticus VP2007-007]